MNTKLLRFTLVLILCGITTAVIADDDSDILLSEDFSDFSIPQGWTNNESKSINNWEIFYCNTKNNNVERYALIFQSGKNAYAITPKIGYAGDVTLSFLYAKTANNENVCNLRLSIIDSGIIEGNTILSFTNKYTDGYNHATIKIRNATIDTKIKFYLETSSVQAIVDDVIVAKDGMTLSEVTDNNNVITAHPNETMTVKTVRTLQKDIWNTLCLPFNISKSSLETAWETSVELREYSSYSDNTMNFSPATSIEAGTPFLIKVGKTISNPTFESVTIVNTPAKAIGEDGSVKFVGTYSPIDLNTDGTHLFITTTGTVAMPTDNTKNHMKGLRAYIYAPDGKLARLAIDGEMTDIQQIAVSERQPTTLFNLNGQRLQSPKKGLIIKDGKLTFTK